MNGIIRTVSENPIVTVKIKPKKSKKIERYEITAMFGKIAEKLLVRTKI